MAAGMTVAGISGREHGSGSKRSFPRRISARCKFRAALKAEKRGAAGDWALLG